jgi:UPF0755 protein
MKLQADPTIQYIIKDSPRRLLNRDLKIKSPYNTYLYDGLPPGPVNNPGKASILAALYPDKNDYLFLLPGEMGTILFLKPRKNITARKRLSRKSGVNIEKNEGKKRNMASIKLNKYNNLLWKQ